VVIGYRRNEPRRGLGVLHDSVGTVSKARSQGLLVLWPGCDLSLGETVEKRIPGDIDLIDARILDDG
jgi:hypothetical protein